jgi:hypothetical protein
VEGTEELTEEFSRPDAVRPTGDLLEREGELAELGALLAQVRAGGGRVLLVERPAGIGKTRLLEAARAAASPCSQPRRARAQQARYPDALERGLGAATRARV